MKKTSNKHLDQNSKEIVQVLQAMLPLAKGGVTKTAISCPKCRNSSVQTFPAKVVVYYVCQYCRWKWSIGIQKASKG